MRTVSAIPVGVGALDDPFLPWCVRTRLGFPLGGRLGGEGSLRKNPPEIALPGNFAPELPLSSTASSFLGVAVFRFSAIMDSRFCFSSLHTGDTQWN